jgi:hypothetical protein
MARGFGYIFWGGGSWEFDREHMLMWLCQMVYAVILGVQIDWSFTPHTSANFRTTHQSRFIFYSLLGHNVGQSVPLTWQPPMVKTYFDFLSFSGHQPLGTPPSNCIASTMQTWCLRFPLNHLRGNKESTWHHHIDPTWFVHHLRWWVYR